MVKVKNKPLKKKRSGALAEIRREQGRTKCCISKIAVARYKYYIYLICVFHLRKYLRKRKFFNIFLCCSRIVKEITPKVSGKAYKWTIGALSALHEGSEARVITILEKANLAAIHAGRVTLMAKDIELAMKLSDATENYKTTTSVTEIESEEYKKAAENRRKQEIENIKKKKGQGESGRGVAIIAHFSPIVSDDDSDEVVVVRRSHKRKEVSSLESSDSESDVAMGTKTRCSKKLMKEQFDFFERQQSFTDELVTVVMDEGWDRVDIENFVLMYNHTHGKKIPLPKFRREKEIYVNKVKEKKKDENTKSADESGQKKGKDKGKNGESTGGGKRNKRGKSERGKSDKGERKSSSSGKNVKKGNKRDDPIVHFGTNIVETEVGELYRKGREQVESEDGSDREDPSGKASGGATSEGYGNNGGGGESGGGIAGVQLGNSGESGAGNSGGNNRSGESGNGGGGESGARNGGGQTGNGSGESDGGNGEDSGNNGGGESGGGQSGNNGSGESGNGGGGESGAGNSGGNNGSGESGNGGGGESGAGNGGGNNGSGESGNGGGGESGGGNGGGNNGSGESGNGGGGELGAGNCGGQTGNGSGESGGGNGEESGNNGGGGESGAGNGGQSNNASGGERSGDITGRSGDDDLGGGGNGGEEQERYKCQFCTHGFDVYNAYLIHVGSKHPRWKERQDEQIAQERRDLEVAIAMQQESEDSETVPVLDERDENERMLVE